MAEDTFETFAEKGFLSELDLAEIEITEDGVATAFTQKHGSTLLFDHDAGRWYEWQGDHWKAETTGRAFNYCRELAHDVTERLPPKARATVRKSTFASGVEKFASADPVHAVRQDTWDSDPYLLGCPGVTVDLKTGNVRRPLPADRITRQTGAAPAQTARCPFWRSFLDEATGGDQGMIDFLQQWFGYCLSGITTEHALAFLWGPGGNGKSVFLSTIAGIMGGYAVTASMDTFAASKGDRHPTDLAMLKGSRMVSASETEEGRAWAESRIKTLTGGDAISARFMRQDFFTYQPQFKLTIVGNHMPVLHNVDDAARRRFNIIPFTRKPAIPDHTLEQRLRLEWPGILRWGLDGYLSWQEHGLIRPASVVDATTVYFSEQDLVGQWLGEKAKVEPGNMSRWETTADLFASWSDFAKANGEAAGTTRSLADKLPRHGLINGQKKILGENNKVWLGINLIKRESYHDRY